MSNARQLQELQEVDTEIEANERSLSEATAQLAGSPRLTDARARLQSERAHMAVLGKQQRSAETDAGDLSLRVKDIDKRLYSGRVTNPKELSSMQDESNILKSKRSQAEDCVLEIMEQTEKSEAAIVALNHEVAELEAEWQHRHAELSREVEHLKSKLAELKSRRDQIYASLDRPAADLYGQLRSQKGTAVARLERGMCAACRIQVSVAKLQQVRAGGIVQCSNCSRILHLP